VTWMTLPILRMRLAGGEAAWGTSVAVPFPATAEDVVIAIPRFLSAMATVA